MTREVSGKSSDRQRDRRAEILRVATRVFYEKGYEGTSIQEIANELNLLKGSLYHYIRSKDDLLVQILDAGHTRMLSNLASIREMDGPGLAVVAALVRRHVTAHLENYMSARVFVHDMNALPEDARRRIVTLRDEYEREFRGLIVRGVDDGTVCPDIDPTLVTKAVLTMLNSIHLWYSPGRGMTADRIAESYTELVVASLRCDPATHYPGHRGEIPMVAPKPPRKTRAKL